MFDFDFDNNDFDGLDGQLHDGTYDSTPGTDFLTTDSTDFGSGMSGTGMEFPHPSPNTETDPLAPSTSDFGSEGKHEPSFEGRNRGSDSSSVQQLDFRPDNNGHNDDYHHPLHQNDSEHHNEPSFKGTPQEKAEWAKKAQSEKEWVDFYNRQADSCLIHNDINGYKKNLELAKTHAGYYDKFIANSKK